MSKNGLSKTSFEQTLLDKLLDYTDKGKTKGTIRVAFTDPMFGGAVLESPITKAEESAHAQAVGDANPLIKSVLNVLNSGSGNTIERLAFETQPQITNLYGGLWRKKARLLPDEILKRISIQDDLVAAICNMRSNQLSAFGRPQPDRFSTGYRIEPEPGHTTNMSAEDKRKMYDRIGEVELKLLSCGDTRGWSDDDALSFSQFLFMSARNAIVFGRIATELLWVEGIHGRRFHSFRPIDAGTVFKAAPFKTAADAVRRQALRTLEQLKNKKLRPERYVADEYSWVQVINGRPEQAFTSEECQVFNFFPTTDVELDGYPITPLDTVITAVTTHINIGAWNKLYFQSGRASKGMLVVKSDDVDENVINYVRQQFNASINGTSNAWRMPIFGVGPQDEIVWQPIDNSSRDMEFQYLNDNNARTIMSAFQVDPEELSGWRHLSRGTASQALSEGNNEYRLQAARDTGFRPLLAGFQNFVNQKILPVLAPDLSQYCSFKFVGLEAETAEKESVRIQQDSAVHMTYDQVLEKVEKDPVGRRWGGAFPLSPQYQAILDKYVLVGDILEHFFGIEGASKDPRFQYVNNPLWMNYQQMVMQQQQMEMQQQQMAQQQQMQQGQPGADQQQQGGPPEQPQQQDAQGQAPTQDQGQGPGELSNQLGELQQVLGKAEITLGTEKLRLVAHQKKIVSNVLSAFEEEAKKVAKQLAEGIADTLPDHIKE